MRALRVQRKNKSNFESHPGGSVIRPGHFAETYLSGYLTIKPQFPTLLAVEHIQPKTLYPALKGRWDNFLLGCTNCNSTKLNDVDPATLLLPDRDNTFSVFSYLDDGAVEPANPLAAALAALVGLDKMPAPDLDANGNIVALERVSQRRQTWLQAEQAKNLLQADPGNVALRQLSVNLARATGYFSVWMQVFTTDPDMRKRLIDAFEGTRDSGCFDAAAAPVTPAPNPDGLPCGGKA